MLVGLLGGTQIYQTVIKQTTTIEVLQGKPGNSNVPKMTFLKSLFGSNPWLWPFPIQSGRDLDDYDDINRDNDDSNSFAPRHNRRDQDGEITVIPKRRKCA